jgi:hypothetical protein
LAEVGTIMLLEEEGVGILRAKVPGTTGLWLIGYQGELDLISFGHLFSGVRVECLSKGGDFAFFCLQ